MNVTQITAMRRRPLEQYGHVEISMVASLDEGESAYNAAIHLRGIVEQVTMEKIPAQHSQQLPLAPVAQEAKVETKPEVKEDKKAETKKEKKAEAKVETKAEEKTETKTETKAETKKESKVKGTPYDRSNDLHKKLMAEFLDAQYTPSWKTTVLQKAKDASIALEGTAFLDAEGLMLPEFKEAFTAKMK